MRLYLVQHGEALSKEADPERPLSEKGRNDARRMAEALGRAGVRAARVLHSGKPRARETAELLAQTIAPGVRGAERAGLDPNDAAEPFAREVAGWQEETLVVGHLPFMERLAARLVSGQEGRPVASFRPGTVVCLERDEEARWAIAWMLRPELLA